MIKVLHKSFDILEGLAETPEQPQRLRQIAGRLGLHPATCANILKTLVDREYVEQVAPRQGYLLGSAVFGLCRRAPYRRDLVQAAERGMADLARAVNETVILVTLRQGRRFILSQVDGQQAVQVSPQTFSQGNVYDTATGRLLMAYAAPAALARIVRDLGPCGAAWPQAAAPEALAGALAAIRARGWASHATDSGLTGLAAPVRGRAGTVVAALGLFLPTFRFKGPHRRAVSAGLRRAAAAISRELGWKSGAGNPCARDE